jgi:excisionase family DNA binding protein
MKHRVDGQLLTRAEAAELLRFSMETLRRLTRKGEIRALAFGKRAIRYRRRDVDGYIERAQKRA